MTLHLIWAEAHNRVIGAAGGIPWHLPGEQAKFRERTIGATVVMGRATWDSLPDRVRPLPGRRNVVLTRDLSWTAPGAAVVHAVAQVIGAATATDEIWVMGGEAIYVAFLPFAQHIVRTRIDLVVDGDRLAPDLTDQWTVSSDSGWQIATSGLRYVIEELVKDGSKSD